MMKDGVPQTFIDEIGNDHIASSVETPIRDDAFDLDDDTKVDVIEGLFREIMITLGLDLNDDSLSGTPHRVAKMYVKEIFKGLNPENRPDLRTFENKYKYNGMVVEKNISFTSTCEHHFLPIFGVAHVAYIPNGNVVGLSKLNRIVNYYGKRPQVQERMNMQILDDLKKSLNTEDVAVIIDAKHMCVHARGIEDKSSTTVTAKYSGRFMQEKYQTQLFEHIKAETKF